MTSKYREVTADDMEALETMVDELSLQTVLEAIATACHQKAEHLAEIYKDADINSLAENWQEEGNALSEYARAVAL